MILNKVLRDKRKERGLTQSQVAEESGITERSYQRIESGKMTTADTAILIARALNSTVEELFGAATPAIEKEPDGNPAE